MTADVERSLCRGIPGFYKGLCAMEKYILLINSEGWHTLSKNGCKGIPLFFLRLHSIETQKHNVLACNLIAGTAVVQVPRGFCAGNSSMSF